jgi:membrane-bound metal-dependent hydrolase YbcI (DUF457 family)
LIFFGHLGLTAGVFKICETAAKKTGKPVLPEIDYRLVLLGSALPDIIDKPIGVVLFASTFHNSRIFAHTLLFTLLLLAAGLLIYKKRRKTGVLLVGLASLVHIILDSMWLSPETLLWPFLNIGPAAAAADGWLKTLLSFPSIFDDYFKLRLMDLLRDPSPLVFELAGFAVLIYFLVRLCRIKQLGRFFKTGRF